MDMVPVNNVEDKFGDFFKFFCFSLSYLHVGFLNKLVFLDCVDSFFFQPSFYAHVLSTCIVCPMSRLRFNLLVHFT